jgi:hypothetical protein
MVRADSEIWKINMQYYVKKGRNYAKASPFAGVDASIMIMGALRQYLGSGSYAPAAAMDFMRDNWQELSSNTRTNVMKDVLLWLGERHERETVNQSDLAWPAEWRKFLRWCFANVAKDEADHVLSAIRSNTRRYNGLQDVGEFFDG